MTKKEMWNLRKVNNKERCSFCGEISNNVIYDLVNKNDLKIYCKKCFVGGNND